MRVTFTVSATRFESDSLRVASVSLHALAPRYERGRNSDAAIRADLATLAVPRPDVLAAGGDFTEPLADGQWVGTLTEIEDRGEPVRIFAVRSFIGADMEARTDATEALECVQ